MNRPKLFKALRLAWSGVWGVVAVVLCVLWVRSYAQVDGYIWSRTQTASEHELSCGAGRIILLHNFNRSVSDGIVHYTEVFKGSEDMRSWFDLSTPICDPDQRPIHYPAGFGLSRTLLQGFVITLPFWFVVLMSAGIAAAPWLTWIPRRFSLRTLFIAMAVVAVALGTVIALSR